MTPTMELERDFVWDLARRLVKKKKILVTQEISVNNFKFWVTDVFSIFVVLFYILRS